MISRKYTILTVLLCCFLCIPFSVKAQEAELVDIVQMYQDGNYKGARDKAKALVGRYPTYDAAYYYMGLCDLLLDNMELAQAELKRASELDPTNYWYRDRLALAYSATGDDDLTIATYEGILKDFPKQNDANYSLVNLYLRHNNLDKALEIMDNIETVSGKTEQITMTKYEIYLHQNKPEKALEELKEFDKEYTSVAITTVLGDHHLSEYEDSTALMYYQQALALDRSYAPAVLGQAEVYRIRRDYPKYFSSVKDFVSDTDIDPNSKSQYLSALIQQMDGRFLQNFKKEIDDLFNTNIAVHSTDTTALQSAAIYYYRSGREDFALDLFEKCAELSPESITATATYIQLLGMTGQWDRLVDEADKAVKRFPQETGFLELKSSAFYNLGDYQGVIDVNRQIISMFPKDTSKTIPALSTIGDMYHMLGDSKSAFKVYDQVLKLRPDYAPVLNNYAYYLSSQGTKLKKAYSMSKITVEKEPDNATYLDTFGWILYLQGKALEAKPFFKHAMLYGGKDSAVMLDHYAEVLYALKEYDLAKVYWSQAKAKNTEGEVPDLDERVEKRLSAIK